MTAQLPDDDRIRSALRHARRQRRRNAGLDVAVGDLVVYLDDDNVMGPAVAAGDLMAADRHPADELFYGADVVGAPGSGRPRRLPTVHLAPFDRDRRRRGNYSIRTRWPTAGTLAEAHYDEALAANVDWDFLLRATRVPRPGLVVPAIVSVYGTDAADRLTGSSTGA